MKTFYFLKSWLLFILLLSLLIWGFLKLDNVSSISKENKPLTNNQIDKIKSNLILITSKPNMSSNPYDQIKANNTEYYEIVQMGNPAVDYFVGEFKKGKLDTSNEWITAWICNEILRDRNPIKIWSEDNKNGWSSGRDWYQKYIKIKKI